MAGAATISPGQADSLATLRYIGSSISSGNNRRTSHRRKTMKVSPKRVRYGISLLLTLAGVIIWLTLPNIQPGQASVNHSAPGMAQKPMGAGLDGERRAALDKL